MRKSFFSITAAIALVVLFGSVSAQTTEFTYQGSLKDGASPANGSYDFEFVLFDSASSGSQVGGTLSRSGVTVTSGAFSVNLDFGNQFPGAARFLEVHVRPTGGGAFTTLLPRQSVGSTPYSVKTLNADNAANASNASNATTAGTANNSLALGGVSSGQYVLTGDSRMSDSRNPLPGSPNYVASNDARLTDARNPLPGSSNYVAPTDPRLTDARAPLPNNASYIQNTTSTQAASNFNVSGTGTANTFNAATQFSIAGTRMLSNGGGPDNLFVGASAGSANTGFANSFVGFQAGANNTSGNLNSFFGSNAGANNTSGISNSIFGKQAGFNSNGSFNSFFGTVAGYTNTTGSYNTIIGSNANVSSPALTNATAIGANAVVGASNSIILGSIAGVNGATSDTSVGIGVSAPDSSYRLHVRSLYTAIAGETTGTAQVGVYGGGRNGVWGSNTNGAGAGVIASSFTSGGIGLQTIGTSWFHGDTTPLTSTSGTGIAIGTTSTDIGYIFAIDYGNFSSKTLSLNSPGGSVGIGTLAPTRVLDVNGRARIRSIPLEASYAAVCFTQAGDVVQCGGSSLRWKTNVRPYSGGLNVINSLRPISYNWKDGGAYDIGLGAEDVAKVDPFFAFKDKNGVVDGVRYERLTMVLINAVKQQQAEIDAQKLLLERQQRTNDRQQAEIDSLRTVVCSRNRRADICRQTK